MIIRKADMGDIKEVAVLFDQYRMFYKQDTDIGGAQKFLTERMQQNESVIFIAILDHIMVGFTQLYPIFSSVSMQRAWLLNDLFVAPEARGSGAADKLLKAAQQMGADTSSRWMVLQTATTNHRAQKVYERNGWKKDHAYFSYYYRIGE